MLTLPSCCGDVDGPTHTLGSSIAGGDLIEPNELSVKLKKYNGLAWVRSYYTLLHVPPKNISFPFSNSRILLEIALTLDKYLWLQSSSVLLNSTELLRLVESSVI